MSAVKMFSLDDFTGGLNTTVSMDSLKENTLIHADNVSVFRSGGIEFRSGTEALNGASYGVEIDQDIMWYLPAGGYIHLVMHSKKLYKVNDTTGVLTLKATLASFEVGYVVFQDKLFFVDGNNYYVYGYYKFRSDDGTETIAADDIVKYLGGGGGGVTNAYYKAKAAHGSIDLGAEDFTDTARWTNVTDGAIPDDIREVPIDGAGVVSGATLDKIKKCTMLEFHPISYRIFAAGNPSDPTALYFSEINNPYAFKGSSELRPTSAAGPITGLQSFVQSMLVSYTRKWMFWDGIKVGTDVEWGTLPIPTGCVNHWAKVLTPYSLTFWGTDGLYIVYPGILIKDLVVIATKELYTKIDGNKIEDDIKAMKNPDRVRLLYHDEKVYFAYGTAQGQRNNIVMVLNWDTKTFVRFTGWQVNDWHVTENNQIWFVSKNYILKYTEGVYNDVNVLTGAPKPIHVYVALPPLKLGGSQSIFLQKELRHLYVAAKQPLDEENTSTFNLSIVSDYVTRGPFLADVKESLVWGGNWGLKYGFVDLVVKRAECGKKGFRHGIIIESNELDNHAFIYSLGFEFVLLDGSEAGAINAEGNLSWIQD